MAFAEGLFAALAVLLWTWPNPPWDALYYGGIVGLIVAPILLPLLEAAMARLRPALPPAQAGRLRVAPFRVAAP